MSALVLPHLISTGGAPREVSPNFVPQTLLRWRQNRALSLQRAADVAGINRTTLFRWETGKTVPRVVELQRILNALDVPEEEQRRCFHALESPRGLRQLRQLATHDAERSIDSPVGFGEILRALRYRAGQTQWDAARGAGVSAGLVSRWENGDCVPNPEMREALFRHLQLTPAETPFLNRVAETAAPSSLPNDRDALEAAIHTLIAQEPAPHLDLIFLTLAGRYHSLWRSGKVEYADAAGIWGYFADFLTWRHGRYDDAIRMAETALSAVESAPNRRLDNGQWAAAIALILARRLSGEPHKSLCEIDWIADRVSRQRRVVLETARAEALCRAGAMEQGFAVYRTAVAHAPTAVSETVWRQVLAEALCRDGRFDEALKVIVPPAPAETRASVLDGHAMTLAWALAGAGERGEAEKIYDESRPRIGDDLSPLMRMIVEPLESILNGIGPQHPGRGIALPMK